MTKFPTRRIALAAVLALGTLTALAAHAAAGVAQPATAQNESSPVSRSLDFPAFTTAAAQTTCDGKPLPLFQEGNDRTYALCVDNRLRRINPDDRVAYSVKVTDNSKGRPTLSQRTLVSPVGQPVVDNVQMVSGYLAQAQNAQPVSNVGADDGSEGELEFNTLGRTSDGKLVVRVRLFQETLAPQQQTITLADGESVTNENGQLLKVSQTAKLLPGQVVTFTEGALKLELSVRPVPNL